MNTTLHHKHVFLALLVALVLALFSLPLKADTAGPIPKGLIL